MDAPDVAHADVVVHHALQVALQVAAQQAHEKVDLGARPAQVVFKRKRVERQPGQTDPRGCLGNQLHAFGTLLVAEEALQRAMAGPAAVAVHDDGHVLRQTLRLERRVHSTLLCGQLLDAQRGRRIQRTRLDAALAALRPAPHGYRGTGTEHRMR